MKYYSVCFSLCMFLLFSCDMGDALHQYSLLPHGHPKPDQLAAMQESDCLGTYTGQMTVLMDGKIYGPYTETITISKNYNWQFVSKKVVYKDMPIDIGYVFSSLNLRPSENGLLFTLDGKNGKVSGYGKKDNKPFPVGNNAAISGVIYKKKDDQKVYLSFTVTYDTKEIKEAFPIIPDGSHKSMSSTMTDGTKTTAAPQ